MLCTCASYGVSFQSTKRRTLLSCSVLPRVSLPLIWSRSTVFLCLESSGRYHWSDRRARSHHALTAWRAVQRPPWRCYASGALNWAGTPRLFVRLGRRIGSTALKPAEPTGVSHQGFVLPQTTVSRACCSSATCRSRRGSLHLPEIARFHDNRHTQRPTSGLRRRLPGKDLHCFIGANQTGPGGPFRHASVQHYDKCRKSAGKASSFG
jgi:hypothetical protein